MSHHRRLIMALALVALSMQSAVAEYPERPVRFIVPSAVGGGPDVSSRLLVAELSKQLGKQFIVDNRPSVGGIVGTEMIARAAPDGYTLGQGNFTSLGTARSMFAKLPFDPDRDLQMIGQTGVTPNLLAVTLSLPVKSVQELVEHARRNPGKLMFASNGNGSSMHLSGELFKRMTGTQLVHVPYKGTQQGITDLIGGQVHLMFDNVTSIGVHVRAGRLRGIAVTTMTRVPAYPELPTVAESGVPQFEVVTFGGVIGPAGMSKKIIARLNAEINSAIASGAFRDKYAELGSIPTGGTPEEFAAFIKRQVAKWATVINDANIKAN